MQHSAIRELVRKAIDDSGKSRNAIAKLAGIDSSNVYAYLSGRRANFRSDTADRLIAAAKKARESA